MPELGQIEQEVVTPSPGKVNIIIPLNSRHSQFRDNGQFMHKHFSPALWAGACLFTVGVAIIYSSSYFFIFDDTSIVTWAKNLTVTDIFSRPVIGFYRPGGILLAKIQYHLFGWDKAFGFSFVSILTHSLSVTIFYHLLLELDFDPLAATMSALLFLASPWATEATLWFSAQFDIFSVFFGLVTLLLLSRQVKSNKPFFLLAACGTFTLALTFKENAIILPAIIFLILGFQHQLSWRRFALLLAPFGVISVIYLIVRSYYLPNLGGAYGDLFSVYRNADILSSIAIFIKAFLFLDTRIHTSLHYFAFLYTGGVLVCIGAVITRPRILIATLLLFCIAMAPVAWMTINPQTSSGGRILYAPGILWSFLIGIGGSILWNQANLSRRWPGPIQAKSILAILLPGILTLAYSSTLSQISSWRFATHFAKNTVDFILSSPDISHPCVQVTNLPSMTSEGPFLFKSYNLSHHFRERGHPQEIKFSANTVIISANRADEILAGGPDVFSSPCPIPNPFPLTLPLDQLRPD